MSVSISGLTQLQRRLNAVKHSPKPILAQIQKDAVAEAKLRVPRKTGDLGKSITKGTLAADFAIVKATKNYAAFVELGTRPHDITPKHGKVLAWPATAAGRRLSGAPTRRALAGNVRPTGIRTGQSAIGPNSGTFRYAKRVHHPGTKPMPFLVPGAKAALEANGWRNVVINDWNRAA